MEPTPLTLLSDLVEAYDERERPVSAAALATAHEAEPAAIVECLDRLATCELVDATPAGYRPTVTARELLELDLDAGEFVVVDCPDPDA